MPWLSWMTSPVGTAVGVLCVLALAAAAIYGIWREPPEAPPEHPHVTMQRLREKEKARDGGNRPGRDA